MTVRHMLVEFTSLGDLREGYLSLCQGEDENLSLILGEKAHFLRHDTYDFLQEVGILNLLEVLLTFYLFFLLLVLHKIYITPLCITFDTI